MRTITIQLKITEDEDRKLAILASLCKIDVRELYTLIFIHELSDNKLVRAVAKACGIDDALIDTLSYNPQLLAMALEIAEKQPNE